MKSPDYSLSKEHLKFYRLALILVVIGFPLIGIVTNIIDNDVYDPLYLRLILGSLVLALFTGTYINKIFIEKFFIFITPIFFLIFIWTCYIAFRNNFSINSTIFYIAAISIISFALNSHKLVAIFSVFTIFLTINLLSLYNYEPIVVFSIITAIVFIQLTAFVIVWSKNMSEKRLKQFTYELQKHNEDKDLFIRILAHDLRGPISSLLGISDQLLYNLHKYDIETIESKLIIKNRVIKKTFNLLESLLLWSRSNSNTMAFDPQKVKVHEVCNEIINSEKENADLKNITIKFFEEKQNTIIADLNMLKIILRNLLSNAIKFTNENGKINISAIRRNNNTEITVSDNGIGISQEDIQKLWNIDELFSSPGTEDELGTGFGLLICKEFVEKHRGSIWVESTPGNGSNFIFSLPNN
jgi:signal transduction histidine kinase